MATTNTLIITPPDLPSKYQMALDHVVLNKFEVNSDQFIFDILSTQDKVFYFIINTNYYANSKKLSRKRTLIGFWHSIFTNQGEFFDFSKGFRYKVIVNSEIYLISYISGILDTSVKTQNNLVDTDDYQTLEIDFLKYKKFNLIQTAKEKEKSEKIKKYFLIAKYVISWIMIVSISSYYLYASYSEDFKKVRDNLLISEREKNRLKEHLEVLEFEVIRGKENAALLQHLKYMSKLINSNIKITGELDLITDQLNFSFQTDTKVEIVKYIAKKENIPIKLKYDFITKESKISWRVEP